MWQEHVHVHVDENGDVDGDVGGEEQNGGNDADEFEGGDGEGLLREFTETKTPQTAGSIKQKKNRTYKNKSKKNKTHKNKSSSAKNKSPNKTPKNNKRKSKKNQ